MDSPDTWRGDIEVPDDETLQRYSEAVVFSEEGLARCLSNASADSEALAPFVIELGALDSSDEDPEDNPIVLRASDTSWKHSHRWLSGIDRACGPPFHSSFGQRNRTCLGCSPRGTGELSGALFRNICGCSRWGRWIASFQQGSVGAPVEEGLFTIDSDKVALCPAHRRRYE